MLRGDFTDAVGVVCHQIENRKRITTPTSASSPLSDFLRFHRTDQGRTSRHRLPGSVLTANASSLPQRDEPAPETPLAESAKRYAGLHAGYQEAWKDGSVPAVNDEQIKKRWMAIPYIHLLQAFILIPGARVPGIPYRVRLNSIDGWSLGTMFGGCLMGQASPSARGRRRLSLFEPRWVPARAHPRAGKPDRTYL